MKVLGSLDQRPIVQGAEVESAPPEMTFMYNFFEYRSLVQIPLPHHTFK